MRTHEVQRTVLLVLLGIAACLAPSGTTWIKPTRGLLEADRLDLAISLADGIVVGEEPGLTHNAALKLGLRNLLFRSKAGPAWAFSDTALDVLRDLWSDVAGAVEESDRRPPAGLEVSNTREVEGYLVRVIRFPDPEDIAENYYAAVAYRPERRRLFWKVAPASLRYLALEHGLTLPEGRPRTVLGEWTAVGHLNYGDGPEPTIEAFIEAIRLILAHQLKPQAGYASPGSEA